jgi:hypothetical protein
MTLRKLLAQAMMLAVVAGSIFATSAAPASAGAADPLIFIIHGLPGAGKADVCVRGSEVASRVPYATRLKMRVAEGKVSVKFRKASKGKCKGKLLAAGGATLAPDANRTFVASVVAGKGKVTSFPNNVAATGPGSNRMTVAHKMTAKQLDILDGVGNKLITGLTAGSNESVTIPSGGLYSITAAKAGTLSIVAGPRIITKTDPGQAFTVVLIGNTKAATRQMVVFKQDVGIV